MKVERLVPEVAGRVPFSLKHRRSVPAGPGCYALATFDEEILYLGLSVDLSRRFVEHRGNNEKVNPTKEGLAFWFLYVMAGEASIHKIERGWLNQHLAQHGVYPILNKIHSPVK